MERRRQKGGSLLKRGSSLLQGLAPWTWLGRGSAPPDDYDSDDIDDAPDDAGKRRRDPLRDGIENRQPKRMRVASPPRQSRGYHDPPASAFGTRSPPRFPSSGFRGLSQLSLGDRTESPQPRQSVAREPSIPLSARPSFAGVRTSMAPIPTTATRDISEPPQISDLQSNPMFVRNPSIGPDSRRSMSRQPTETLGSLLESQKLTRSPAKQRSSLLFGTPTRSDSEPPLSQRFGSPAEKALQGLDVYKTPLLPTRLRTATNTPGEASLATAGHDMFRSRREKRLILMKGGDFEERRLNDLLGGDKGKEKEKDTVVNGSKPYAGQGGMRKLLERRRKEEKAEKQEKQAAEETQPESVPESTPAPIPDVSRVKDWYSAASEAPGPSRGGSSLRISREKTNRQHFSRPQKPNKFAAPSLDQEDESFEDDARREKELKELQEAARKAPVFNIPQDFSFAPKEVVPQTVDTSKAKEPPISNLPFSFGAPPKEIASPAQVASLAPAPPVEDKPSTPAIVPPFSFGTTASTEKKDSEMGVPNFFASSSAITKPAAEVPPVPKQFDLGTPPMGTPIAAPATTLFGSGPSTPKPATPEPGPASTSLFGGPVKDISSPFWDKKEAEKADEKKDTQTQKPAGLFAGFGSAAPTSGSLFGGMDTEKKESRGTGAANTGLFGSAPVASRSNSTSNPFSFGSKPATPPAEPTPAAATTSSSGFSFPSTQQTAEPSKALEAPKPFSFGSSSPASTPAEQPKPTSPFSLGPATPSAEPQQKSLFGAPSSKPAEETSKSLFGPSPAGVSTPTAEPPKNPFAFGAAPTTPPPAASDPKPSTSIGFSTPSSSSTSQSQPAPFSFGQQSSAAQDESKPFGGFGAQPARPATPPKKTDDDGMRMEESPVRDVIPNNANKPAEPRPSLGFSFASGSGFGSSAGSTAGGGSLFGQQPQNTGSSPFAFNSGTSSSNPFGKPAEENKTQPSFALTNPTPPQTATGTTGSFSFGSQQLPSATEQQRPSTTGSFSFGSSNSSNNNTSSPFNWGAPSSASSNPFGGGPSSGGSAPSSPFTQPTGFNFNGGGGAAANSQPTPSSATTFAFGSQPASPASGNTSALPQSANGAFNFGGGGGAQSQPSFGAPSSAGGSAGGTLFTMGAAPPAARQVKGLPKRRGGKR